MPQIANEELKKEVRNYGASEFPYSAPKETKDKLRSNIEKDLQAKMEQLRSLRESDAQHRAVDMTLGQFVREAWGLSDGEDLDSFYKTLGISPSGDTIENLFNKGGDTPDGFRWLVPEVIREAVRLGLRRQPMYPNLMANEQMIEQRSITMPEINKSGAVPKETGERETLPIGTMTFNERQVSINKVGVGMEITDEVQNYVALNVLSQYLQDVGVNLGLALDNLAINILVNGDQSGGGMSAPTIGVENPGSPGTYSYKDFLRAWFRMGRIGRSISTILTQEGDAIDISEISEFKGLAGLATTQDIRIATPIPSSQQIRVHGGVPNNQAMMIDPNNAMVKLTSRAMQVESERIAQKQLTGTYVTTTTGFANLFRDARLLIDRTQDFANQGFPSWMDVDSAEDYVIN